MVQLLWCSEPGSCWSLFFLEGAPLRPSVRLHAPDFACCQPFPVHLYFSPVCPSSWPAVGRETSKSGAAFDAPAVAVIAEAALILLISAPFARCVGVSTKHSQCAWQQNRRIHKPRAPPPPHTHTTPRLSSACSISSFVKHRWILS